MSLPPTPEPVAELKATPRAGRATITILRAGRKRRYRVRLGRYHRLRESLLTGALGPWSGSYLRRGLDVTLWRDDGVPEFTVALASDHETSLTLRKVPVSG